MIENDIARFVLRVYKAYLNGYQMKWRGTSSFSFILFIYFSSDQSKEKQ